ncbi:MAG TPA: TetR/AcrR family transcriptional regulator [Kribbellaceae bacterium]
MSSVQTAEGRTYRGADPAQRRDERRARLVDAAVEVFGTTGYRSATVERICAAAGLTKRYFYESFESSEALLLAAYARCIDELHASMVSGAAAAVGDPDNPDLDAMVRGGLVAFFGTIDADPRLAKVAFFEILGVSPAVDDAYRAVLERFAATVRMLAEPAFHGSGLTEEDRGALADGVIGAVLMIAQHWVVNDRRRPVEAVVRTAHTIVTAVLDRLTADARS